MKKLIPGAAVLLSIVAVPFPVIAAAASITVQAHQPGARIHPAMWGVFFEDINFGADGGLYAELVKNRSFEFPEPLMGWTVNGTEQCDCPSARNSRSAPFNRVTCAPPPARV